MMSSESIWFRKGCTMETEVGGLIAGDVPTFRVEHMPYGGVKDSGFGREGLRDSIQEMTEPKLLVMNLR
jgi:glyceraldehyde-3-phosphate dehydrogenase (NADP+)